jgi:uncharacterized protein HemY
MTEVSQPGFENGAANAAAIAERSASVMAKSLDAQGSFAATSLHAAQSWNAQTMDFLRRGFELQMGFAQKLISARAPSEGYQLISDHLRDWSSLLSEQIKEASILGQEVSLTAIEHGAKAAE